MTSGVLVQVVDIPGRHIETDPKDSQDEVGIWLRAKVVVAHIRNTAQHWVADKELPV